MSSSAMLPVALRVVVAGVEDELAGQRLGRDAAERLDRDRTPPPGRRPRRPARRWRRVASGPSSATSSVSVSGPRELLSTTWCPAATLSRATVPPIIPLPMMPTVVMTAPTADRGRSFRAAGYWHFRSKEDLLEGVSEQVWVEIDVPVDPSVPWPVQLQRGLESLISVLRAHPAAPQLLLEHEKRNEAALRATEAALEILHGAGFNAEQASEIARSTLWTGIMLVMSEPGWAPAIRSGARRGAAP